MLSPKKVMSGLRSPGRPKGSLVSDSTSSSELRRLRFLVAFFGVVLIRGVTAWGCVSRYWTSVSTAFSFRARPPLRAPPPSPLDSTTGFAQEQSGSFPAWTTGRYSSAPILPLHVMQVDVSQLPWHLIVFFSSTPAATSSPSIF